jgi:alpha-mannosidase
VLKTAFPVDVRSTHATYNIQFGNMERPNHWNTSWDVGHYENPAHKWVDLSEGDYGVALLNDCKYGYDAKDNVLRLTLHRAPTEPDETADQGKHEFTYSLLPHAGTWRNSSVIQEGYALNDPLFACAIPVNPAGYLPETFSWAELNVDHVVLETVKKAEDGNAWVIRVYETKQYRNGDVHLTLGKKVRNALECNLIEREEQPVRFDANTITFAISPYEIKTFKVWLE